MTKPSATAWCFCGRSLPLGTGAAPGVEVEVACVCGRRLAFEGAEASWIYRGCVVREGQPGDGSGGSRIGRDIERYSFEVTERGARRIPVQIVFSPSQRVAEVIRKDAKPLLLAGVSTPTQARRKWIEWRNAARFRPENAE